MLRTRRVVTLDADDIVECEASNQKSIDSETIAEICDQIAPTLEKLPWFEYLITSRVCDLKDITRARQIFFFK